MAATNLTRTAGRALAATAVTAAALAGTLGLLVLGLLGGTTSALALLLYAAPLYVIGRARLGLLAAAAWWLMTLTLVDVIYAYAQCDEVPVCGGLGAAAGYAIYPLLVVTSVAIFAATFRRLGPRPRLRPRR